MDARLEYVHIQTGYDLMRFLTLDFADSPAASLGIKEGDAHVIRNAGGIA